MKETGNEMLAAMVAEAQGLAFAPPFSRAMNVCGMDFLLTGARKEAAGFCPTIVWDPLRDLPDEFLESEASAVVPGRVESFAETDKLRQDHWALNRGDAAWYCQANAGPPRLLDGHQYAPLAVVLGTGPSLKTAAPDVLLARKRGAVIIGVNQIADYMDPSLLDYHVVMSPRADPAWWVGRDFCGVKRFAAVTAPPEVVEGPRGDMHWFTVFQPGFPWFGEVIRGCPGLPVLPSGLSVAVQAFWLACRFPGIKAVALAGVDLSFPGGVGRPGERDAGGMTEERIVWRDCWGELIRTSPTLLHTAMTITAMAAMIGRPAPLPVFNAGMGGLLGCFDWNELDTPVRSDSDRSLSIDHTRSLGQIVEDYCP